MQFTSKLLFVLVLCYSRCCLLCSVRFLEGFFLYNYLPAQYVFSSSTTVQVNTTLQIRRHKLAVAIYNYDKTLTYMRSSVHTFTANSYTLFQHWKHQQLILVYMICNTHLIFMQYGSPILCLESMYNFFSCRHFYKKSCIFAIKRSIN